MTNQRRYRLRALVVLVAGFLAITPSGPAAPGQSMPDDGPRMAFWRERMRRADSLLSAGAIGPAIDELEELRGSPPVRARSEDYPRVLMMLARAYAWWGDIDRSIERVAEALALGYPALREIATGEDFVLVRLDERFARLVAEAQARTAPWERLWKPSLAVDRWRDTLAPELRAAGVSALWSAAKHSYAWFERLGESSWDSLHVATLREALATPSTLAYYRVLQRMAARLGDAHTMVEIPPELVDSLDYAPPVRTSLVDGRALVTAVLAPGRSADRIAVGDEIVAVDGLTVARHVAERIEPWVSASSPQDRTVRCYDDLLLSGPADSRVILTLLGADGVTREVSLERAWCRTDLQGRSAIDIRRLAGNVGYIGIDSFDDEYIVSLVDRSLERISDASAVIIDLRRNAGGHTLLAFEVLGRFIGGTFETHQWETPVYRAYFHARGRPVEWYREPAGFQAGTRPAVYSRPVVLLVGARTMSAAEHFAVAFDFARRGVIVGEPTAGSTGHSLAVALPGGGRARITTTRDYYPDGTAFNGSGVVPAVTIRTTRDDVRCGRDGVLDAALLVARSLIDRSAARSAGPGTGGEDAQ